MHRSIELIHRDLQIAQQEVTIAELRAEIAARDVMAQRAHGEQARSYVSRFTAELDAAAKAAVVPPAPIRSEQPLRVEIPAG